MVNSRRKGHDAELKVAAMLHRHTGLTFTQTPGSGSGKIKGDLWLKHHINAFLIEVKFYKDDAISTKVFTNKSNNFVIKVFPVLHSITFVTIICFVFKYHTT